MSAVSAPVRPRAEASLRPLPWRRMGWVIWRQHRAAVAVVALLLGGLAVYLWLVGTQLHQAYAAAVGCHPAASGVCAGRVERFNSLNRFLLGGYVLQPVPALIGAFVGAPLLARELETGTFRYAWTQGFGRTRWTIAKLAALALTVAVAAGAISALLSWYYRPYFGAANQALSLRQWSPLDAYLFDLRGAAFVGWTLVAFAIGALAGVLIRQVVPAIAATLALSTALAIAAGMFLRQHYLSPLATASLHPPGTAWLVGQWWTVGGRHAAISWPPGTLCPPSALGFGKGKPPADAVLACFARHGYTLWHHYQPAARFWAFQSIEGGWLLALSVLLMASTVVLVRRRAA